MTLRPILSAVAGVELGLAALLVLLFAVAFGITESDDVLALGLSAVILAVAPITAFLLNKSNAAYGTVFAAISLAAWPFIVWWLVVYG